MGEWVRSNLIQVSGSWSKCKGGLLQPWSHGHLGWNLVGEPTQEGQCPCLGWVPLPPGSGALKMGFQGTISPNYEWLSRVWMLQRALQLAQALQRAGALQWVVALQWA